MTRHIAQLALLSAALVAGTAFAHAKLLSTSLMNGAQLEAAPTALTLEFAAPVKLTSVTVTRAGTMIPVPVDRTTKATATVVVSLPVLGPGHYAVRWSVISPGDGHVGSGTLAFTIRSPKS